MHPFTLDEYQRQAYQTAIYPGRGQKNLTYPTLGLAGEAGELANDVKKMLRDDGGLLTDERRQTLIEELGDVLWYVAAVAEELNINLSAVAQINLNKLSNRVAGGFLPKNGGKQ